MSDYFYFNYFLRRNEVAMLSRRRPVFELRIKAFNIRLLFKLSPRQLHQCCSHSVVKATDLFHSNYQTLRYRFTYFALFFRTQLLKNVTLAFVNSQILESRTSTIIVYIQNTQFMYRLKKTTLPKYTFPPLCLHTHTLAQ